MNQQHGKQNLCTNKKALLTPGSARDSSAAWWIGIQYWQRARYSIYAIAR